MCEPIFNEDGWPKYREHSEYSGIFILEEDCPTDADYTDADYTDADYTDADYYAYHDADGTLLDKESG